MKIMHIINTLDQGGAQSVLRQLIQGWNDSADQHQVISLKAGGAHSDYFARSGIEVRHLNLGQGILEARKVFRLARWIRTFHPDLIQTWLYHSDLFGSIAGQIAGRAPVIWGVHHTTSGEKSVKASTWVVVRLLAVLSSSVPFRIICCSKSAFQSHQRLGYPPTKMVTIPNGVDTDSFLPDTTARARLLKELRLSVDTHLIGMFARDNPQKDHKNFIQAASILLQTEPHTHFVLAGDGIENSNPRLARLISEYQLDDRLHLLGSRQDMAALHAGVDVVTLSSAYGEALPMTLAEGMACGSPCVATDVGDVGALIGSTGQVVPPRNPVLLAEGWNRILKLPYKEYQRLSIAARQRIIDHFSLQKMADGYKQVYAEALSKK